MNKDIVIISEDYPPELGGVSQWAYGVAQGLHDIGCRVRVYCRSIQDVPPRKSEFPVYAITHSRRVWKHGRSFVWKHHISNDFKRHGVPDLIITSKWSASRGIMGIATRKGVPVVTTVHGLDVTREMPGLKKRWLISILNRSAKVLSVSEYTAAHLRNVHRIPREKIVVLPNGVNPSEFKCLPDTSALRSELNLKNARVILTLSRVIERKGHDMVIKSLPMILREVPEAVYVIAGTGKPEEIARLQRIGKDLNVQDKVLFAGKVPGGKLVEYYNLCDVYVMPSRVLSNGDAEGFGITFLEANACAKPVIGGRSGGIPDAIDEGENGFLVDPINPDEIADKIIDLLTHPETAEAIGRKGLARVENTYNWQAISARLLDLCLPETNAAQP